MLKVSNGAVIRRMGWRTMKASKTRNLIAVLAIALTTVLFTSLFTIAMSINDGFQQSNFRQVGGFSHGGFKYLTEEQFEELRDDPLIDQWGVRRFLGMPTQAPFNKSHVEVSYADANYAHWSFCDPVEGSLPQEGTDQAATDTAVLELLGIEPEIGAKFTLTFDVDGHTTTQTFTLCGWWERDEAIAASHVLIPESRVDAVLAEVGVDPASSTNGMTGTWNLDVMLKSGSRHIGRDLNQILADHGYQNETAGANYIDIGINWGYTGAQLSDNLDPIVAIAIAAMLLSIIFTGYLIIYNVFQISVTNDIRFYGLLKNHRHHPPAAAADHPPAGADAVPGGHPSGANRGLVHRRPDHAGHRVPAGRNRAHDLREPGDLPGGGAVLPGDGAPLLPEARAGGRQGLSHRGGAVHRGRRHQAQAEKGPQRRVPPVHGLGQPGPQPE